MSLDFVDMIAERTASEAFPNAIDELVDKLAFAPFLHDRLHGIENELFHMLGQLYHLRFHLMLVD